MKLHTPIALVIGAAALAQAGFPTNSSPAFVISLVHGRVPPADFKPATSAREQDEVESLASEKLTDPVVEQPHQQANIEELVSESLAKPNAHASAANSHVIISLPEIMAKVSEVAVKIAKAGKNVDPALEAKLEEVLDEASLKTNTIWPDGVTHYGVRKEIKKGTLEYYVDRDLIAKSEPAGKQDRELQVWPGLPPELLKEIQIDMHGVQAMKTKIREEHADLKDLATKVQQATSVGKDKRRMISTAIRAQELPSEAMQRGIVNARKARRLDERRQKKTAQNSTGVTTSRP